MAIPDSLSSATQPPGTGRTIRCLVVKDGRQFEVPAIRQQHDADTDAVTFPSWLYEGDGFTLIGMEGEPDFEDLPRN